MSVLFRRAEQRALTFQDVWGTGGPAPRLDVSPEKALRLAPVYAATRLLSDAVASLPIHVFRKRPDGNRERIDTPEWLEDPSTLGTAYDWKHRCMTSLLLDGNSYGLRINGGDRVEWLDPRDVTVNDANTFAPVYYVQGRQVNPRLELLHIRAYTVPGKAKGLSPLSAFSLAVQLGLSAGEFARDWFMNRSMPSGTLKNTSQTVTPDQARTIKERFRTTVQNGDTFVHGSDWEYTPLAIPPQDAQLVEMLKLSATQVASVYGVPPEMIGGESGGSLTYNSPEQNTIYLVTWALRPWLVRLEDAFSWLLPDGQGQYVKFNVDSMIRTELKTRYEAHRIGREIGLNNVDELRKVEDMPPLPDGQGEDYTPLKAPGRTGPQEE